MSGAELWFRTIDVHRMPGVARRAQGFTVGGLVAGVNVVHGPNGSGKTTTALAIQALLWPRAARELRPVIGATVELEGAAWTVELDGRTARWRREGAEATAPDVGEDGARHRYRLALAELVRGAERDAQNDAAFAAVVGREMAGGFDLDAVSRAASYDAPPEGVRKARDAVKAARDRVEEAKRVERELAARLGELPRLERERDEGTRALALAAACRRAMDRLDALERRGALESKLAGLPPALARCHADDEERLEALDERVEECAERVRACERTIEDAERRLAGCAVPDDGVSRTALDGMQDIAAALVELERRDSATRSELERSRSDRDRCLARLEEELSSAQLEALAVRLRFPDVEALAREAHALEGERAALESRRARLPSREELAGGMSSQTLRDGARELVEWLATPPVGSTALPALLAASLMALGLAVALAALVDVMWLAAAAVALAPLAVSRIRRRGPPRGNAALPREALRARYEAFGLEPLEEWTEERVAARLRELEERIVDARMRERRLEEHDELDGHERRLAERRREHDARRGELQTAIGVSLPDDAAWLPVFAASVTRWQKAADDCSALASRLESLEGEARELRAEAAGLVTPLGLAAPSDAASAARSFARLADLDRAAKDRSSARVELAAGTSALETARAKRREFFAERDLAEDDREGLRRLGELLAKRATLEKELTEQRAIADGEAHALAEHAALLELSREALEARKAESESAAVRRDDLLKEIVRLQKSADDARAGYTLTDARLELERREDELRGLRDEAERRAVGRSIVQRLRDAVSRADIPEVFQRAREIFARVTAGRFELLPPASGASTFRARDTVDALEKSLDELSSGERVQLLLSVRLGFLEHQERYRLPLLLDETLGTSDDARVGAIMDAVIEVAKDGRQVVYFTAQSDEVGKWRARLGGTDVPFAIVDLAAARGAARAERVPLEIRSLEAPSVPLPYGLDHLEYGRALGVEGLDPFAMDPEQAHLWHVVDDPATLHALLESGLRTVGQFLAHRRHVESILPPGAEETVRRIEHAASALAELFESWRSGRARPVALEEVRATGAVSDTFDTEFATLLESLRGDPRGLLEALDAGRIQRWRRSNTEKLRAHFEERGVLPTGDRRSAVDLELRVTARFREAIEAGHLTREWVRRVIASLPDVEG